MVKETRAQSILEFCVVIVVVIAALLSMQAYMKRGLQGRWKDSVDQLGDQYAPDMSGTITHTISSEASTTIIDDMGFKLREDTEDTTEERSGELTGSLGGNL